MIHPTTLITRWLTGLLMLCALAAALSARAPDSQWQLAKNEAGIQIYTRNVPGSDFKEFKAVTTVRSSLSALSALLRDVSGYPRWMADTRDVEILKDNPPHELIYYLRTAVPFPFRDRDAVYRMKVDQETGSKKVILEVAVVPDLLPGNDCCHRIKRGGGLWTFTPLKTGMVVVFMQMHVDPGGNIPAWLANSRIVDFPFQTLSALREQIMKEPYRSHRSNWIQETGE